MAVLTQID